MIRLSCGLVTVIKARGDDVPQECGEDLEICEKAAWAHKKLICGHGWVHYSFSILERFV